MMTSPHSHTLTPEQARDLARQGAEDGTLVWAREQTAGRGRQGREWSSPRGNLYLSLVLRPECPPREAVQLAFVAALGAAGPSAAPPTSRVRVQAISPARSAASMRARSDATRASDAACSRAPAGHSPLTDVDRLPSRFNRAPRSPHWSPPTTRKR